MCITCIVSFGLCYPPGEDGFPNHYEWVIENNLNFIVMGTLGATALVGIVGGMGRCLGGGATGGGWWRILGEGGDGHAGSDRAGGYGRGGGGRWGVWGAVGGRAGAWGGWCWVLVRWGQLRCLVRGAGEKVVVGAGSVLIDMGRRGEDGGEFEAQR